MLDKNKVVVGMSGGVDSTVAAYLLKQQGYQVIGITMKLYDDDLYSENLGSCGSLAAIDDAKRVADKLEIPFYVIDFKKQFKDKVIDYFVESYQRAETPNPCVKCNIYIKFGALLDKAKELGAYYIATGHYARLYYDEQQARYRLFKSKEMRKDQTYMLASLSQEQLKHVLFPLGEYDDKKQVREIAERLDIDIASKGDSQEICFIADDDYARFLTTSIDDEIKQGNFVDQEGNILGQHKGIIYYTIGQRKGLGVSFGKPMYVVSINAENGDIVLGEAEKVFAKGLIAREVNLITNDDFRQARKVGVRIRHSQIDQSATMQYKDNQYYIEFEKPARAVTPGQALAFYEGDEVLGGGFIDRAVY